MAANNPITITCPKCQNRFKYDVIKNLGDFEIEREEEGSKEGMGKRRILVGIIYCEKCEVPLELHVTLYPFDDIECYEVKEIEVIKERTASKVKKNKTNYHADPLF